MKSRVHPKYKTKYHVGNWPAYDRALVQRGDITVWLAPDAIATWEAVGVGKRGGQLQYSDLAIETALTLRLIFHLPLRQTEGFLTSIFGMLGQWIQRLHTFGLLRGSFRPTAEITTIRTLLRHRDTLVEGAAACIQRMQKALTLMNLQLHTVISDVTGVTAPAGRFPAGLRRGDERERP